MKRVELVSVSGESPILYDVAKNVCHEQGLPWTDPRTGVTYQPPKKKKKKRGNENKKCICKLIPRDSNLYKARRISEINDCCPRHGKASFSEAKGNKPYKKRKRPRKRKSFIKALDLARDTVSDHLEFISQYFNYCPSDELIEKVIQQLAEEIEEVNEEERKEQLLSTLKLKSKHR